MMIRRNKKLLYYFHYSKGEDESYWCHNCDTRFQTLEGLENHQCAHPSEKLLET